MALVNMVLPSSATPFATGANTFTQPEYPFMPYSPPEYDGPDFNEYNDLDAPTLTSVETCEGIVCTSTLKTLYPKGPKEGFGKPMSYIYTFPTIAENNALRLYGHRSFGAFGEASTVETTNGGNTDVFNGQGVRLANQNPATCSPSYMAITVFPKGSDGSTLSGKLSMKLVADSKGQNTKRPYRGDPAVPPDTSYDSAAKLFASTVAAATLVATMI